MKHLYNDIWTDQYSVRSYEVDINKKLTIESLLQYFQESAWNHAEHLDVGYNAPFMNGKLWVLSQITLEIDRYALWGEIVQLRTWAREVQSVFALRDFELLCNGIKLACGASSWLVIDAKTRRPQRINSLVGHVPFVSNQNWCKVTPLIFPDTTPKEQVKLIKPFYSDLDFNLHVNNTRYIRWVIDSYPLDFLKVHHLKKVQINYLAEVKYDNEVEILSCTCSENMLLHSIRRLHDSKELCRLSAVWEKN